MPMLGKPTVTAMTRVDVENGEPRNLAGRDAYERAGISPPQLVQFVGITRGFFEPARRCWAFVSAAGKARQPLADKCQRVHEARAGARVSITDEEAVFAVDRTAAPPLATLAPSLQGHGNFRGRDEFEPVHEATSWESSQARKASTAIKRRLPILRLLSAPDPSAA
jgi:hypothetical protein